MTRPPSPTAPTSRTSVGAAARVARKIVVAVIGLSVLALGMALIVLPGPAFVVIPVGLAILATEFVWARKLLHRVRERALRLVGKQPQVNGAAGPHRQE